MVIYSMYYFAVTFPLELLEFIYVDAVAFLCPKMNLFLLCMTVEEFLHSILHSSHLVPLFHLLH